MPETRDQRRRIVQALVVWAVALAIPELPITPLGTEPRIAFGGAALVAGGAAAGVWLGQRWGLWLGYVATIGLVIAGGLAMLVSLAAFSPYFFPPLLVLAPIGFAAARTGWWLIGRLGQMPPVPAWRAPETR